MPASMEKPSAPPLADLEKLDPEKAPIAAVKDEEDEEYPALPKLILIMTAVYLSMFLVALDRTILGVAIPKITDDFNSIDDVGWYASSYLLTTCAFQLIYGRIYTFYSAKWVLLVAIGLFEVGSTVCGAAPNSIAFIVGRALAGLGAAGIFSGAINIMVISVPLHKRPMFQGIFGSVFGIASICGPLIGGAFTTRISWRWCFYINLPIGAVVVAIILLILKTPPSKSTLTLHQQFMRLDPLGCVVFLPGVVSLLLALQWGGTTYPWSNWRVIFLFILAAILLSIFVVIQFKMGDNATVPIHIAKQRSILSGAYFSATSPGSMMVIIYFLPLWFQAIKNQSAVRSGISTLPLVMALVFSSIFSGVITQKTGYYTGQLIAASIIMSIGSGLITTFKVDSNSGAWIGYQFLFGIGLGLGMQQPGMAAQTSLAKKDVMTGVSLMFFMQGLGGAVWVSVAQTVFTTSLIKKLSTIANITPSMIVHTGATEVRHIVPAQYLDKVLFQYNAALSDVFKVGLACAAVSIIGGLTMEWKSVKGLNQGAPQAPPDKKEGQAEEVVTDAETVVETPPRTAGGDVRVQEKI